jgi:hypothetical protein
MSDYNVLQPKTSDTVDKEIAVEAKVSTPQNGEIDLIPVKQYFDLDANDTSQDKYIESILDWAKSKGLTDRHDISTELRKLELQLGSPELGERRSVRLSRYLELDMRLSSTIKEMNSYRKA